MCIVPHQKCTVFSPIGLSHILLNQLGFSVPAAVLWKRRAPWRKLAEGRKPLVRWKALRAWAAVNPLRKRGREARKRLLAGGIAVCGFDGGVRLIRERPVS